MRNRNLVWAVVILGGVYTLFFWIAPMASGGLYLHSVGKAHLTAIIFMIVGAILLQLLSRHTKT